MMRKYYQVQFGDVLFYKWLNDLGLTSKKSLSIGKVQIPGHLFFDFLRGEWDGDGSIIYCRDKRWKNSYAVSISFASGSEKFLIWLQKEINFRLKTTGHISRGCRVLQLRYAREDSKKVFDAMFYNDSLPHLKRKFAKAQKIFKITGLS